MSDVEFVAQPTTAPPPPLAEPPSASTEDDEPASAPRWFWLRSLQSRLVAGVVTLVLLLVLAIGACTFFALKSFLDHRFDQQLASASAQNANFFSRCLATATLTPGGSYQCDAGPQTQREWVGLLVTSSGASYSCHSDFGANLLPLTLTPAQREQVARNPDGHIPVHLNGTELRTASSERPGGV